MKGPFDYFRRSNGVSNSKRIDGGQQKYIQTLTKITESTKNGSLNWNKLHENKFFLKVDIENEPPLLMILERIKTSNELSFIYQLKNRKNNAVLINISSNNYFSTLPFFEVLFKEIRQYSESKNLDLLNNIIDDLD